MPEPAFPGSDTLRGRAAARPRLHEPRLPGGQEGRRARHRQQRDGHRGRGLVRHRRRLPRGAPRRAHRPQVHLRQADRSARRADGQPADPVRDPPPAGRQADRLLRRRRDAVRPAEARPRVRPGPSDGLRPDPRPHHARRGQAEAEHPRARRPRGRLRRRHARRGRRRHLLHGLQDHVPVLRRGPASRRRTTTSSCSAASSIRTSRTSSSSACSSRSAR